MSRTPLERRPLAGLSEIVQFTGLPEKSIRDQAYRGVGIGALAFKVGRYLRWDWDDVEASIARQKNGREAA